MMIKVTKIISIEPYTVICTLSNGGQYTLDVSPLIRNHSQLNGVKKLLSNDVFRTARIGDMGEITWDNIVETDNITWNYDISPEYIYYNGVKSNHS